MRHILMERIETALVAGVRRLWKYRDELKPEDAEVYAAEIMLRIELELDEVVKW